MLLKAKNDVILFQNIFSFVYRYYSLGDNKHPMLCVRPALLLTTPSSCLISLLRLYFALKLYRGWPLLASSILLLKIGLFLGEIAFDEYWP